MIRRRVRFPYYGTVNTKVLAMKVCGLDVHKSRCWVHIRDENGVICETTFSRTPEGLETIHNLLSDHQVTKTVMESTNSYWLPIYRLLHNKFDCYVINAYQRKVLGKHKTDTRDAEDLARWGLLDVVSASYVPSLEIHELRQLVRTRTTVLQKRTAVVSQLKALLEGQCPGLTNALKEFEGKYTQLYFHDWRSNPSQISFKEWIDLQSHTSTRNALLRRKLVLSYWWERPLSSSIQSLVDFHLRQYEFYSQEVKNLDNLIHDSINRSGLQETVTLLQSIPGLGFITCATVACELGSSTRFKTGREAAASCGLTPRLHGSAGRIRAGRITKHGPSSVRRALYITCKTVIQRSPYHREFFQRIKSRRGGMIALVAL
ncbi:MAG: IS110 family RNA-guided transposase, partial [Candidatus Hodarchaeales archaeon]